MNAKLQENVRADVERENENFIKSIDAENKELSKEECGVEKHT
jgi:hypothetical protein